MGAKLAQQIIETERRVAANREMTRTHYSNLKSAATNKLVEPKTLLAMFAGSALLAFLTGSAATPPSDATPGTSRRAARFRHVTDLISTLTRASVVLAPLFKWFLSHKTVVTKTTEPPPGADPTAAPSVEETVIKES